MRTQGSDKEITALKLERNTIHTSWWIYETTTRITVKYHVNIFLTAFFVTLVRYSGRHAGRQQRYPTLVCYVQLLNGPSGVMEGLEPSTVRHQVFLNRSRFRFPSGVQWRAGLALFSSDVQSISIAFAWCRCSCSLGWSGRAYSHVSFKVLAVEDGQFVKVGFSHRSALWAEQ